MCSVFREANKCVDVLALKGMLFGYECNILDNPPCWVAKQLDVDADAKGVSYTHTVLNPLS